MTQEELGAKLETGAKNVQRMEAGKQNLGLHSLAKIAAALTVDPMSLLAPPGSGLPWLRDGGRASLLRALATVDWRSASAELPRPPGSIPFLTLRAAASPPIPNDEPEVIAWLLPPKEAPRTSARWFVAQVSGASMEPKIPNGSLCLFRPVAGNDYVDRVLLVQHRGVADLDTGGSFAVKRIARVSRNKSGTTVVLESVNQRFKPIVIESRTDDELRPIAELDRVLWSPATAG